MTLVFLILLPMQLAQAETINIPLKIDFSSLQQLLITQLFTGKSTSIELLHDPSGCSEIVLSEPKLSELNQHLKIDSRLNARLGVKLLDKCVDLVPWDGYIQIISDPVIKTANPRQIFLKVVDIHLITLDKEPLKSGALWDQTRNYIEPLMDQFHMDLTPSIDELKSFVPLFLSNHTQTQVNDMLESLHLAKMRVTAEGIESDVALNVESVTQPKRAEKPLTQQEQQLWQQKWQSMDALFTYTIKKYAAATQLKELRLTLFDILLNSRHQLQEALIKNQETDPVRHWFIKSWTQLIPVLKQISAENPKHAPMALMSLVTATDALQALDKLGPSFGLDISIDGLRRLARILNNNQNAEPLKYNEALDPELLKLFKFDPSNKVKSKSSFNLWPISSAKAATSRSLNSWVPAIHELNDYLPRVRKLLLDTASQSLTKSNLTLQHKDIFKKMIMATAWQESCWRQYKVKKDKIVPLSSYTGDTGIMQVNEKVWRGFVDRHKLRWDIDYNVQTGSNILLNYMTRYAIKNAEHKKQGGLDNLARSTYSAYNGGPGQYSRYRNSSVNKKLKKIDTALYKKYLQVKQGNELAVGECLGLNKGEKLAISTQKKILATIKKPQKTKKKLIHDSSWIKQQRKAFFTLQLGVFSSHNAANKFIQNQTITGNYAIYQQQLNQQKHYAIIYGFYSTRDRAINESKQFKKTKPWPRSFKAIRELMDR